MPMIMRGTKYFNNSRQRVVMVLNLTMFMAKKLETMTASGENPAASSQNCLAAVPRVPLLMQDYPLLERLVYQNRGSMFEHTAHARAQRLFGTLTITHDITQYS